MINRGEIYIPEENIEEIDIEELEIEPAESYVKLKEFFESNPTKEDLENFITENPGLITIISDVKGTEGKRKLKKFSKKSPFYKEILNTEKLLEKSNRELLNHYKKLKGGKDSKYNHPH